MSTILASPGHAVDLAQKQRAEPGHVNREEM